MKLDVARCCAQIAAKFWSQAMGYGVGQGPLTPAPGEYQTLAGQECQWDAPGIASTHVW